MGGGFGFGSGVSPSLPPLLPLPMLLLLLLLLPGLSLPPAKAVRAPALEVVHEVMRVAMREGGHEGGGS